jgi:CheY-like chemotaxis protein
MGTGLGLATVYGIVKQNGGHIYAASSTGSGTTFTIYLPLYEGSVAQVRSVTDKERINLYKLNILFVEDELTLSAMTETMLKNFGCTVTTYTSSEQALELPGEFIRKLDLLLTDVVMPGMNGKELSQRLRRDHPELKVLFISGYSADILPTLGTLDEYTAFLQKPFTITELAEKIEGMM